MPLTNPSIINSLVVAWYVKHGSHVTLNVRSFNDYQ